jgi:hypothetical protein
MGEKAEPLYDDETTRIMSEAYEAADKKLGESDKSLQVTMAVAIIRGINDGERDVERLTALAISAVRGEAQAEASSEPSSKATRSGWVDLTGLFN